MGKMGKMGENGGKWGKMVGKWWKMGRNGESLKNHTLNLMNNFQSGRKIGGNGRKMGEKW